MPKEEEGIKYGYGAYLTEMDVKPGNDCLIKTAQLGGKGVLGGIKRLLGPRTLILK